MNCGFCGGNSKVVDSRPIPDGIRRRRECLRCGRRFSTHEKSIPLEVRVLKAGNRSPEDFSPDKIAIALQRVCKGRPIGDSQIDDIVRRIEADLGASGRATISSSELAFIVLDTLKSLDRIAYMRFVSNYTDAEGRVSLEQARPQKPLSRDNQLDLFNGR